MRVLITPRSLTKDGHPAFARLVAAGCDLAFSPPGKQPSVDELVRLVPGCAGWLAGVEPIPAAVLEAADALRVISRNGVGIDNIDLEAARRRGIRVCRAEGANARGVAELTIALMFSLARSVPASDRAIKSGGWERWLGLELEGRTLGLIGCGQIGRIVARLALGLGMEVVAYDPAADAGFAPSSRFRYAVRDEVFARAHVLSLHCPAPDDGRAIVDSAALAALPRGALLVNTARAGLVDAAALEKALESGQVAGAALDVFAVEPPSGDRLALHPRVVATPHIGSYTRESVDRLVDAAVENLLCILL